jgi:YYY domain-containing protein
MMTFWEIAWAILRWWAATLVLGLALWPVVFQCLRRLPDRGWAFTRMAGILAVGYFFWLGAWLRVWPNIPGAAWLCAGALFVGGSLLARARGEDPWAWLRAHAREAAFTEAVFFVLLAGLTWIRAYDAGATHTERPMDLAFLNAILRSTYFPPSDPWLSGYAISYYHFGYILTGMLAKLTGMAGSVAFSFGVTGSFSMAGLGAYGLLRNILLLRAQAKPPEPAAEEPQSAAWRKPARGFWRSNYLWLPLVAVFTLLFLGNLEIGLEILYAQHVGWQGDSGPFWTALDITDLNVPPTGKTSLTPTRSYWWWWAASRVVHDHPLGDQSNASKIEVIDEFPAFSFVIGDMHPHVMALPFLLLAVAVILETFLRGGGAAEGGSERGLFFGFTVLSVGSLLFLNTWDILIFGMAVIAAFVGWRMSRRELVFGPYSGWKAFLARWALAGVLAVTLFIPFLIGFASQAGGILPNALFPTKGGQFFVMFGTLLIPLGAWIGVELLGRDWKLDVRNGLLTAAAGLGILLVGSLAMAFVISLSPDIMARLGDVLGGNDAIDATSIVLLRRITDPWATLLPLALIAVALMVLLARVRKPAAAEPDADAAAQPLPGGKKWTDAFLLILVGWGALLILAPEYFYLRDFFGGRMNTVFKFYFQGWAFLSLAAAYGIIRVAETVSDRLEADSRRWAFSAVGAVVTLAALLVGSLYYPLAVWTKTDHFASAGSPTLDGSAFLALGHPEDAAAIKWILENIKDDGPFVEGLGDDYDAYAARVATHTGIPSLLGWIGHEDQWRGTRALHEQRIVDIEQLYRSTDWIGAKEILDKYGIEYVYFGPLEAGRYGERGLAKFRAHMRVIYEADGVIIFKRMEE